MYLMRTCICLFAVLISVSASTKNYYFVSDQNVDDDWSSKEIADQKEESNENNDFKFDDQSTFKVSVIRIHFKQILE